MDINNLKSCIDHEEAIIESYAQDPQFAEYMLSEAIADGDIAEVRRVYRRLTEARRRQQEIINTHLIPAAMA